jgi:hypothetical protein
MIKKLIQSCSTAKNSARIYQYLERTCVKKIRKDGKSFAADFIRRWDLQILVEKDTCKTFSRLRAAVLSSL